MDLKDKSLSLAILGTRGIPACYGGFETFAEELSWRLVKRGYSVVVYGRKHVINFSENYYRGVRIKLLPAPQHKYLETPIHGLLSFLSLMIHPVDVALVCNSANSPFVWLLRLRGIPVAVNVDGVERLRAKWNILGRMWYRLGEWCSVKFANTVVSDAEVIRQYYLENHHAQSRVIAYGFIEVEENKLNAKLSGATLEWTEDEQLVFQDLSLKPDEYLLYVSRLEPENNAHVVIEAFNNLPPELRTKPLVIVGDAPYARGYIQHLKQLADKQVLFCGFRFGRDYRTLQLGALLYIQATEVGGTHPALVEAMGFANCIVANNTPENVEVLGDSGRYYSKNSASELTSQFRELLSERCSILSLRRAALERAKARYSWELVTDKYEDLFRSLAC